jgi:ABC-2 type transport system permease protein
MKTLWYIAKKDLTQTFKDRSALLLLIVVPLALIAVIGLAFGNLFGSNTSQITMSVALSNQDSGYVGQAVTQALKINNKQLVITVHSFFTIANY